MINARGCKPMDDFETFARDKIAKLRAEADGLEKTLKEFQAIHARKAGAVRRSGDQPRAGAFGVILEAITAAGPDGLTLDQMTEAAGAEGYDVKRPTLRSQVWQAAKDGTIIQIEPGRYRAPVGDYDLTKGMMDFNEAPRRGASEDFVGVKPVAPMPREDFAADLDDEIPF
jgi:hypothetical protein